MLLPSIMGSDSNNNTNSTGVACDQDKNRDEDQDKDLARNGIAWQQDIEQSIARIRSQTLAPIQTLLGTIPQLRLRSEHRKSAMNIMLRYQKKLELMRAATGSSGVSKHESARVKRNRAKLHAASTRFKELDESIRNEVIKLLNSEIATVFGNALPHLHQAQETSAKALVAFGSQVIPHLVDHMAQHEAQTHVDTKKQEPSHSETSCDSNSSSQTTPRNNQHSSAEANLEESIDNFNSPSCLQPQNELCAPCAAAESPSKKLLDLQVEPEGVALALASSATTTDNNNNNHSNNDSHAGVDRNNDEDEKPGFQILPKHVLDPQHSVCAPKKHVYGTHTWKWHQFIKDSLANGLDVVDCVKLPEGCAVEEWIAVHVIDFFNEISLLFGTISEFCTPQSCPEMTAGPCYTYLWADGVKIVAPITLPAAEYIAKLMTWIEDQLDDPNIFPSNDPTLPPLVDQTDQESMMERYRATGKPMSPSSSFSRNKNFINICKNILKRLFRVYAHVYHNHLDSFVALHVESHLNFCFKRFVFFVKEFDLIDQKELNALRKLIISMQLCGTTSSSSAGSSTRGKAPAGPQDQLAMADSPQLEAVQERE